MADKPHIFLGDDLAESIEFLPVTPYFKTDIPTRDVHKQAAKLRIAYSNAIQEARTKAAGCTEKGLPVSNGFYLDVELDTAASKSLPQLDTPGKGAKLMSVKEIKDEKGNVTSSNATIFLPKNHENWFVDKLDRYEMQKTQKGQPKNKSLINPIDDIKSIQVRSLFPHVEEYDELQQNITYTFEIWIAKTEDGEIENNLNEMKTMGFDFNRANILDFEEVYIILVNATKEVIDDIPFALDNIEAVKRYYNPAEMLSDNETNRDWSKLIAGNVDKELDENSPRVSIIDRGVNNGNLLLTEFLPDEKCLSVVDDRPLNFWGDHGTGMAGLTLYGDLSEDMWKAGRHVVNHNLASVKIQSSRFDNEPELYGKLTVDAIEKSEEVGASIDCMAITEDREYNDGIPTSWSAAIDKALYHDGKCDRLMILSAGDTLPENIHHGNYMADLNGSSIQTPCEALNAIVVGSYTERVQCQRNGYLPEAASGGISPLSRTAMLWRGKNAKPDIVMEGGNLGYKTVLGDSTMPELSLITTSSKIPQEPLQDFNATSASAALAARLAAKIKYANPDLSALSVRALIIHSANWTDEMRRIGTRNETVMSYCGYGVPDEKVAVASSDTQATFIFENELVPYQQGKNDTVIYKDMHFYELPWPKGVLLGMGSENVRLRVTLSYYIEPSPTHKSSYKKYRYQSAGLTFDVKTVNETRSQFIARHNCKQAVDVEEKSKNDTDRWAIGQKLRSVGTVQSDWFECTAAELATCNEIGIFPTSGWWKNRKLANVDNKIKYSLVVSVITSETPIYDAIANVIKQQVGIAIED